MALNAHFRLPTLGRLALPPLVERELRVGARRPLFYWLRGLLALAAGFQGYELLDRFVLAPPPASALMLMAAPGPTITGATLLRQMSWLLFLGTLLMGLVSADSINRERREGTLGLLLLTDLTPAEIVWGKMLSCGLTSFLVLLGALPALMFPVLAGGVTGSEAALIGLGLLNTLFVALAAGLWMSTVFRERRHAVPATLGLVGALAFGPEVLGAPYFGIAAVPYFRLFGLGGWMTATRIPVLFNVPFVVWFMVMHSVGWLFLWRARVTLATSWQDQPHEQEREPEPAEEWPTRAPASSQAVLPIEHCCGQECPMPLGFDPPHPGGMAENSPTFQRWGREFRGAQVPKGRLKPCAIRQPSLRDLLGYGRWFPTLKRWAIIGCPFGTKTCPGLAYFVGANPSGIGQECPRSALARTPWLTDPRPWDADPIRWRVERLGSAEGLIWLAVALSFLAQFGTLGSILGMGAGPADTWGLVSFVGMAVILFSGGLIAWAGARFFQDTRREQDLQLLLTTPLGARNILTGQWRVLRRVLAWPLGLVLALALPAGISLLYDFANGYHREFWFLLQPFLIAVNLALEVVALCWVGMRFGLHGRNAITAVAGTVGLVQLLPLVLAVALMWGWAWLPGRPTSLAASRGRMPPVILALLFFVAKNLALIVWARLRLRRELRLGRRTSRLDASASRLIVQRA